MVGLRNLYKMISISTLNTIRYVLVCLVLLLKNISRRHYYRFCLWSWRTYAIHCSWRYKGRTIRGCIFLWLSWNSATYKICFWFVKGLMPDEQALIDMNKTSYWIREALNKPVCATCDVHYLTPEEKIYREIMLTACGYPDADEQPDLHLRYHRWNAWHPSILKWRRAYEVVVTNTRCN